MGGKEAMISAAEGVNIVINDWLKVKLGESVLIVADDKHIGEAVLLRDCAKKNGANAQIITVPENSIQDGKIFEQENYRKLFRNSDIIIGSTTYSLVTTEAVHRAIKNGRKFLSLPLSTNNGRSMMEFDFLTMNTNEAKCMALPLVNILNRSNSINVTTALGTDIHFDKTGRQADFFNGESAHIERFESSSFEVYVAIQEQKTNGTAVVDGSLGYIGSVNEPIHLEFKDGWLVSIEKNKDGCRLQSYIDSFNCPMMYTAAEFGIGLNKVSRCKGECYIEDESTYGTFHIGMGRNISLGGNSNANGHFDLVFCKPTIYADDKLIMLNGDIIL